MLLAVIVYCERQEDYTFPWEGQPMYFPATLMKCADQFLLGTEGNDDTAAHRKRLAEVLDALDLKVREIEKAVTTTRPGR